MFYTPKQCSDILKQMEEDVPQIKEYLDFKVRLASQRPHEDNIRDLGHTIDDYQQVIGEKGYRIYHHIYNTLRNSFNIQNGQT